MSSGDRAGIGGAGGGGRPRRPLRVPVDALPAGGGRVALSQEAGRYVARVHRLGPGDALVLFDPDAAREADAVIASVGRELVVEASASRAASALPPRRVTLIQATGKGDKLDAIVRDATELGAAVIVPAVGERSISRPAGESAKVARWRRIAVEAARQCGRGDAPAIEPPSPLREALARHAPGAGALGLCLDPGADAPLGRELRDLAPTRAVVVVVGPEGGLGDAELAAAAEHGFRRVAMGSIVLRTETVCAAVLGALLALADPSPG